jgi:thiol:disulfide interchange protein DsbC
MKKMLSILSTAMLSLSVLTFSLSAHADLTGKKEAIAKSAQSSAQSSPAKTATEESVMAAIKSKYPKTAINSVKKTEINGLFEVSMGNNIAYTDGNNAQYLLFGHIYDMDTQTDITQARIDDLSKIDFKSLPIEKAIKVVKGNGSRVFAVLTDPDCPYCKQLENNLKAVDDYTMYVFLFPIANLHPEAEKHAAAIWCAKDRSAAWEEFMSSGKLPNGKADCETPIKDISDLAQSIGVQGTPTLFHVSGSRVPGSLPADQIDSWLGGKVIKSVAREEKN